MILNFELLRIAIALGATALAAWQDQKTSFIDDKITFGMIGAGIFLNVLTWNYDFMVWAGLIAAAIAVVGFFAYKTGQFGGGDVLLFLGLHLLLPVYPQLLASPLVPGALSLFQYPFVLSVFLASSYFAILGSAVFYAQQLRKNKGIEKQKAAVVLVLFAIGALALFVFPFSTYVRVFLLLLFASGLFLVAFKREVMDCVIVRRLKISQIEDEDILSIEKMPARLVRKYGLQKVLTQSEVAKLKKIEKAEKMRLFPVCKVLPRFGPYVLLGLIACLLFGDLFFFILLS